MSDESILNTPSATAERAPTAEYTPLPQATPSEPKRKEYDGNDTNSMREAAADLDRARAEGGVMTMSQ